MGTYPYTPHPGTGSQLNIRISAASIETETMLRWYIIHPALYHDSFYTSTIPAHLQIPTQVTGAIAEAVTLRLFHELYAAHNVVKIRERPSSKTADFAMDIVRDGQPQHCLVESKGSNSPRTGISSVQLDQAWEQLQLTGEVYDPPPDAKFASLVSFRNRTITVIEVS